MRHRARHGRTGTFADAARFGETIINCTAGTASPDAFQEAGSEHFAGKILIDVANRLEMTAAGPRVLTGDTSLGEDLQHALPNTRVVKALNTANHQLMVNPSLLPEPHHIFLAGNDTAAKAEVGRRLGSALQHPARHLGGLSSPPAVVH